MIAAEAKMQNARPRSIDEQTEKRAKEAKSEKTRRNRKGASETAQVCAISPRLGAIRILLLLLHDHQQRSKPAYTH